MAYFSKEMKKAIAPKIAALGKKFGIKASLAVRHHSQVVLTIASGGIDFIQNVKDVEAADPFMREQDKFNSDYLNVNVYHFEKWFTGKALEYLKEAIAILNEGNYDHSDSMTDYFCVGHYVDVRIGNYDKPYKLMEA